MSRRVCVLGTVWIFLDASDGCMDLELVFSTSSDVGPPPLLPLLLAINHHPASYHRHLPPEICIITAIVLAIGIDSAWMEMAMVAGIGMLVVAVV